VILFVIAETAAQPLGRDLLSLQVLGVALGWPDGRGPETQMVRLTVACVTAGLRAQYVTPPE
jgi:hypothetical protein